MTGFDKGVNLYVQNESQDLSKNPEKIAAKPISKVKGAILSPFAPAYALT